MPISQRLEEIAFDNSALDKSVSAKTVEILITIARKQLFGKVSDAAIFAALKRDEELAARPQEKCHLRDCDELLPYDRRSSREFCTPAHRVHAHRHPELVEDRFTRRPEGIPAARAEKPRALTDRQRWILEVIDFRTQSGLKPEEVAPEFAIPLPELQAAIAAREKLRTM